MIDLTLRECPFCGNPAEIVDGEPFSFMPKTPTKKIRCCSEYCIGHTINIRYQPDLKESECGARNEWNTRRRKNRLTFNDDYVIEHEELKRLC
jgi:hypothetical protein